MEKVQKGWSKEVDELLKLWYSIPDTNSDIPSKLLEQGNCLKAA